MFAVGQRHCLHDNTMSDRRGVKAQTQRKKPNDFDRPYRNSLNSHRAKIFQAAGFAHYCDADVGLSFSDGADTAVERGSGFVRHHSRPNLGEADPASERCQI